MKKLFLFLLTTLFFASYSSEIRVNHSYNSTIFTSKSKSSTDGRNLIAPQNINIVENNGQLQLTWEHVSSDIWGAPLEADYYNIYKTESLTEENYEFVDKTKHNYYSLPNEFNNLSTAFFKITAVFDPNWADSTKFVLVENGTFHNGSSNVTLNDFLISKYEVTQSEYQAIIGENPSFYSGLNKPVENVNWFDAVKYCNLRSIQEGLSPCYSFASYGTDPTNWPGNWNSYENHIHINCDFSLEGYRLPTEMEWMYAAKGGNLTLATGYDTYSGTNNGSELTNYAWFSSNNDPNGTKEVGTKLPNQLGLYDMSGNVYEMCWDIFGDYSTLPVTNPTGPSSGNLRSIRGGSYYNDSFNCQVVYRTPNTLTYLDNFIGFRIVRSYLTLNLPNPDIIPQSGSYRSVLYVSIDCQGEGESIFYTLDGSDPDATSSRYIEPIMIYESTTIKAIAYKTGCEPSSIITRDYEIVPVFAPDGYSFVEYGTFHNGSSNVTISDFFMSKYEVTQGEYEAVVGVNPSYFAGQNKPVEQVNWFDAVKYCNLLSIQEGLNPCYIYNSYGTDPANWPSDWNTYDNHVNFQCNFNSDGYRLPTEMEWMYAAKGGRLTPATGYNIYAGTNDHSQLVDYAWYSDNNDPHGTKEVGSKMPNQLGLYDMNGNVLEMCWDIFGDYSTSPVTDPIGASSGNLRMVRGGGWNSVSVACYVNNRTPNPLEYLSYSIGFRIVRRIPLTTVADPIINPGSGLYHTEKNLTITCPTEGAEIYFTLDGSIPNLSSMLYTEPFLLNETLIIKARAYKAGSYASDVTWVVCQIDVIPPPEGFIAVGGGSFNNGSSNVTVDEFFMSKFEITQSDYESIMGLNPSENPWDFDYDNHPVDNIFWLNAIIYCNRLSFQEGLTPCYNYNNEGTDPDDWPLSYDGANILCNFEANGYRLPTEMEWMYAAKGGDRTPPTNYNIYSGTDDESQLVNYAWYYSNIAPLGTKPVGGKLPNQLGLYDMSGNVGEWCWDYYGDYPEEDQINPTGPPSGTYKILRGGGHNTFESNLRISHRQPHGFYDGSDTFGFRIVKSIDN
ncbi:SUMF1/EgtB/PvdO family nonheme iron enzyme [bacterium]|nr:SUMF1/EgtB/PvdO family nonheme iron enzyme [bacterium]